MYSTGQKAPRTLADVKPGDHVGCFYETDAERRAFFTGFVRWGLERNEKVICILAPRSHQELIVHLRQDGLEISPLLERGQVVLWVDEEGEGWGAYLGPVPGWGRSYVLLYAAPAQPQTFGR